MLWWHMVARGKKPETTSLGVPMASSFLIQSFQHMFPLETACLNDDSVMLQCIIPVLQATASCTSDLPRCPVSMNCHCRSKNTNIRKRSKCLGTTWASKNHKVRSIYVKERTSKAPSLDENWFQETALKRLKCILLATTGNSPRSHALTK